MSTEYEIAKSGTTTFTVGEGSNKFDLEIMCAFDRDYDGALRDLTTEQLIEVATKMLRVAAYWSEHTPELTKKIEDAGKRALNYSEQLPTIDVKS